MSEAFCCASEALYSKNCTSESTTIARPTLSSSGRTVKKRRITFKPTATITFSSIIISSCRMIRHGRNNKIVFVINISSCFESAYYVALAAVQDLSKYKTVPLSTYATFARKQYQFLKTLELLNSKIYLMKLLLLETPVLHLHFLHLSKYCLHL